MKDALESLNLWFVNLPITNITWFCSTADEISEGGGRGDEKVVSIKKTFPLAIPIHNSKPLKRDSYAAFFLVVKPKE